MAQVGRAPARAAYGSRIIDAPGTHPPTGRWLVDGNNVMGSRPDGWWRDRAGAARRLVAALGGHAWPAGTEVTVVFDGPPPRREGSAASGAESPSPGPDRPRGPVDVVYAGAGSTADDRLVQEARAAAGVTAVTSDRELARRLREVGATVVSAGRLLALLDDPGNPPRR